MLGSLAKSRAARSVERPRTEEPFVGLVVGEHVPVRQELTRLLTVFEIARS